MANALREGGVYLVGDQWQDANGKETDPPTKKEERAAAEQDRGAAPTATPLPDDFPSREILVAAGFTTMEGARAASDEALLALDGIGPATLQKIRDAQG